MMIMKKTLVVNVIILGATFLALSIWFSTQEITLSEVKKQFKNTPVVDVSPDIAGAETMDKPLLPEKICEGASCNIENKKSSEKLLKEAFSKKYNKNLESIFVIVETEEGLYAQGSVDFDNSGYPAKFFASNNNGEWEIVAVENGVVACAAIEEYSFPRSMIPQCYSITSGKVVTR